MATTTTTNTSISYNNNLEKQIVDLCYTHVLHNYTEPYYFSEANDGMATIRHDEAFAYTIVEYMMKNELTKLYRLKLHDAEDDDGSHQYWLSLED